MAEVRARRVDIGNGGKIVMQMLEGFPQQCRCNIRLNF